MIKGWVSTLMNVQYAWVVCALRVDCFYEGQHVKHAVHAQSTALLFKLEQQMDLSYGFKVWREKDLNKKLTANDEALSLSKIRNGRSDTYAVGTAISAIHLRHTMLTNEKVKANLRLLSTLYPGRSNPLRSIAEAPHIMNRCGSDQGAC